MNDLITTSDIAAREWGLSAVVRQFEAARPIHAVRAALPWSERGETTLACAGGTWQCTLTLHPVPDRPDALDGEITFRLATGAVESCNVAIELEMPAWSPGHYVFAPAAVYNGNRFQVRKMPYPPMYRDAADIGLNPPIMISDVPHLECGPGESRLQLNTGDMATPCLGFFAPAQREAVLLLTTQASRFRNHGLGLLENADRTRATLTLETPCMRSCGMYVMACSTHRAIDRAPSWRVGEAVTIPFRLFVFPSADVQGLFDRFALVRKDLSGRVDLRQQIPFSAAWEIQERKFNRDNWRDAPTDQYYAVAQHADNRFNDWQLGWVGGGISGLPLMMAGTPLSRDRALRTIDFLFRRTQRPSGLLVGIVSKDLNWGDGFNVPGTDRWVMTRKIGDGLYFVMKHLFLLRKSDPKSAVPELWRAGTLRLADRLLAIWNQHGQFGQLLDYEAGTLVQGGSTAGAILPAALALAGQFFDEPRYLEVAAAAGEFYYRRDVRAGLTTGGPGEILSAPDSESAFAMLESFVVLYEVTGKPEWLARAGEMARQGSSWVQSYDYRFPPDSPLGRLDLQATGSVWANVQNKHSAPGLCTLSGDALFKLWRATRDPWYLELLRDIVHGTPQYLSRADRPVHNLPDGWMCERVNTSDWEYNEIPPGHVFYGSCWCETSNMLSYVEVPGLYVNVDLDLALAFDHIDTEILGHEGGGLRVRLRNPTRFDARVRVLCEARRDLARPLGQLALWGRPEVWVPAGRSVDYLAQ